MVTSSRIEVFGLVAVVSLGWAAVAHPALAEEASPVDCSREAGSLPFPNEPMGHVDPDIPIEHVVVIIEENHSFDNVLGRLNVNGYLPSEVDGVDESRFNLDSIGRPVHPYHLQSYCVKDTEHGWDSSHRELDGGKNDAFITENDGKSDDGYRSMGYYDQEDMPYFYAIANRFTVGDRYFSSALAPTYPNRFYSLAATSFGHISNDFPLPFKGFKQKTIFDNLNAAKISWKYYYTDLEMLLLFQPTFWSNLKHVAHVSQFKQDLKKGRLPFVVFIESSVILGDEHPPFNFQLSQHYVARRINDLIASQYWKNSVLFLTYDENGGYYDHVAPPAACAPDEIAPMLGKGDTFQAGFDQLGFRVPFIAISPYAKRHHISHEVYDHTSILKFIETKFNLPALTRRDANANPFNDVFDFGHPDLGAPTLPPSPIDWRRVAGCFDPFKKPQDPREATLN